MKIKYLHTMVRVKDLEKSIAFYKLLGLEETRRMDNEGGRFTLVFMAPPGQPDCPVELTYNWDGDDGLPSDSRHFGHLAYGVEDIYALCKKLQDAGVVINRPPRDGHMAFVRSPDNISVELLQDGKALEPQSPGPAWAIPDTGEARRAKVLGLRHRSGQNGRDRGRWNGHWNRVATLRDARPGALPPGLGTVANGGRGGVPAGAGDRAGHLGLGG